MLDLGTYLRFEFLDSGFRTFRVHLLALTGTFGNVPVHFTILVGFPLVNVNRPGYTGDLFS